MNLHLFSALLERTIADGGVTELFCYHLQPQLTGLYNQDPHPRYSENQIGGHKRIGYWTTAFNL